MQTQMQYDVAQICENGHVVNWYFSQRAHSNQKHCTACGAATVKACKHCSHAIRGGIYIPGIAMDTEPGSPPSFCHNCGKPYPWVERSLAAATSLIEEEESLTATEKAAMTKSLPDLVRDVPETQVAVARFKKYILKLGKPVGDAVYKIMVDVMSEAVKKTLEP